MNFFKDQESDLTYSVSVVMPAKNEALAISNVIAKVLEVLPEAEVIVVNDGSSDATGQIASDA